MRFPLLANTFSLCSQSVLAELTGAIEEKHATRSNKVLLDLKCDVLCDGPSSLVGLPAVRSSLLRCLEALRVSRRTMQHIEYP